MDERLFARLAVLLEGGPVVLAGVRDARGATPRDRGSRMLITTTSCEFSVGGGLAEARVIEGARTLLRSADDFAEIPIDLRGGAGSAGVCGGVMRIALHRWSGAADLDRARELAAALQRGERVAMSDHAPTPDNSTEGSGAEEILHPDPRLLIVGAGHCGLALYELARALDFELWVHDERSACFEGAHFGTATQLCGSPALLERALDTQRDVYAVLLNRDYAADVAALDVLCRKPPCFVGMMGSNKRIAEVRRALPHHAQALATLHAPVGLDIDAQTPHEIAVSILAQLVQERRRHVREAASAK